MELGLVRNQITKLKTEIWILKCLQNNKKDLILNKYPHYDLFLIIHEGQDENYYNREIQKRKSKIFQMLTINNEKKSEYELKETTLNMQQSAYVSGLFFFHSLSNFLIEIFSLFFRFK